MFLKKMIKKSLSSVNNPQQIIPVTHYLSRDQLKGVDSNKIKNLGLTVPRSTREEW